MTMYHFDRTATLTGEYTWVDFFDPAFNTEAEGFSDLALSEALEANDWARIDTWVRPGEKLTRWKLRHLSDRADRYIRDEYAKHSSPDRVSFQVLRDAACLGLCGVEELIGPNGQPFVFKQTARHPRCEEPCIPPQTLDMLAKLDGGNLISRIGLRVMIGRAPQGN